jgi:hyperosmotically inducible protein
MRRQNPITRLQTSAIAPLKPKHLATSQTVRRISTTAKNIKVITANGQVTLRGPVKTAQEKAKVDQIARSAAGGAQIDDQLDVKESK